jgi:hypothetical protein
MKYPMQNNVWVGYFEDVPGSMDNMNQVIPLEFARYILLHPELDPQWREHARKLIEWVKTTPKWPKYIVHGAMITTEQGDGKQFCCNLPNQCCDSHSARLAATEALYYAQTDDALQRGRLSHLQLGHVLAGTLRRAHAPFSDQWWFTDEFADGPRRMMDAFWAVPEWAPGDESHLLGSLSVVTRITYKMGSVTYSTFDSDSTDVLRLNFRPDSITIGGQPIASIPGLGRNSKEQGYSFDEKTRTLVIHHNASRDIDIQGQSDIAQPSYITFDDPHLSAGTELFGQYPSGVIDWGAGAWQIGNTLRKVRHLHPATWRSQGGTTQISASMPRAFSWESMRITAEIATRRSRSVRPRFARFASHSNPESCAGCAPAGATRVPGYLSRSKRGGASL